MPPLFWKIPRSQSLRNTVYVVERFQFSSFSQSFTNSLEFKGTGNMEMVLDRGLSEKRVFPAIDLPKSSTRRDDLLLTQDEKDAAYRIRKAFSSMRNDEAVEKIIDLFRKTRNNREFVEMIRKIHF